MAWIRVSPPNPGRRGASGGSGGVRAARGRLQRHCGRLRAGEEQWAWGGAGVGQLSTGSIVLAWLWRLSSPPPWLPVSLLRSSQWVKVAAAAAGPAPAAASAPPPSWGPRSRRGSGLRASTLNAVTVLWSQRANRRSTVGGATPPSGPRPHPAPPPPPPRRRGPAARGEATRRGRVNGVGVG